MAQPPATGGGLLAAAGAGFADPLVAAAGAATAGFGAGAEPGLAMSCGVSTEGGVTMQGFAAEVPAAGAAAVPAAGIR